MPKNKTTGETVKVSQKAAWKRFIRLGFVGCVLLVLLASSIYFFLQYQKTQSLLKDPTRSQKEQLAFFQQKIGKHYVLPQDSNVTLAAVSDSKKLSSQAFFANAQNGDQILIYPDSGLAIVYRPSIDRIIYAGQVNKDAEASASAEENLVQPLQVALYNGTTTVGLTRRVEDVLLSLSSIHIRVTAKEDAGRSDYADSVVVDLTGNNKEAASRLARMMQGEIGQLPSGEIKPSGAEILIILGSSYVENITPYPSL